MMHRKFIFLVLISFWLTGSVAAQFSKGMRMPGLSLASGFFNSGTKELSTTSPNTRGYTSNTNSLGLTLAPSLGWFITDEIVIGAQLIGGYKYDKNVDDNSNITFRKNIYKYYSTGLGAFARKYFTVAGSFIPFGQLNLAGGFGSAKSEGFYYATNYKETYTGKSTDDMFFNAGISLGVTKMLNDHIGIDFFGGYLYSRQKNTFKTTTQIDIDFNGSIDEDGVEDLTTKFNNNAFTVGIAFQLFLDRKNK